MKAAYFATIGVCFGLAILIAGISLITTSTANEIPLWYGTTLCPTSTDATKYIGQNLPQAGACPATLNASSVQTQVFSIDKSMFSLDGLDYHPIIYRTSDAVNVQFKLEDGAGKLLLAIGPVVVSNTDAATPSKLEARDADEDAPSSNRRLMKGGRGAGASGRSRTGYSARYLSGNTAYRTHYGYYACCVTSGSLVYVHRTGPMTRNGYYDSTNADNNCGDKTRGCAFEVAGNLYRDEFSQLTFVPTNSLSFPLKLTITQLDTVSAAGEPQVYFTFWTDDLDNKKVASYLLLPLGCLLLVGSMVGFFVFKFRSR